MKKDKRTKGQKDKWTFVLSICPFVLLSFILCSCGGGNLALLQSGQELFYQEDFQKSDAKFEEFNKQNESPTQTSIAAEVATLVGGARTNDYKPYMMDELFASYYQLLDALALGDFDTARVIINQSYARQQKMSSEYKELIGIRSRNKEKLENISLPKDNEQWQAYSDIMNPALTYLAGLYFLNTAADNSDWENARIYLSRASGMMPDNGFIKQDLDFAQRRIRPSGAEWTIIETGAAPKLVQEKMTLPWLIGKGPMLISFAVSKAVRQPDSPAPAGAALLADTDAMFMTEYQEYRINEIIRAAAKTAADTALQSAANNQSVWLGLGAAVYSYATTAAETRSWDSLPKKIWLSRGAEHKAQSADNEILINLKNNNRIVYIKR